MFNFFLDVVAEPSFMERNGTAVWILLALVALAGLVGLFIWKKRRKGKADDRG
jgi:LPXTG-motif cell wall-anchored protein